MALSGRRSFCGDPGVKAGVFAVAGEEDLWLGFERVSEVENRSPSRFAHARLEPTNLLARNASELG